MNFPRVPITVSAATLFAITGFMLCELAAQSSGKSAAPSKPGSSTGKGPREIRLPGRGRSHGMSPAFSPDSATLLWYEGRGIAIWDLAQEKLVDTIQTYNWAFVLSPDGKKLAADRAPNLPVDRPMQVYDVATRQLIHELSRPQGREAAKPSFNAYGFDRTGDKLYTRTDVDLQVWDMTTGKMLRHITTPRSPSNNVSVASADGSYLTVDSLEVMNLLDLRTEKFLPIQASKQELGAVLGKPRGGFATSLGSWSFTADGRTLLGTDQLSGMILEWSLPQGRLTGGTIVPGLMFAKVSADGSRILATYNGDDRNMLRVLDRKTKRVLATLGPLDKQVAWYAISPDNRWVFGSSVGDTRLWDLEPSKSPASSRSPGLETPKK
jgi:hypothetical protein